MPRRGAVLVSWRPELKSCRTLTDAFNIRFHQMSNFESAYCQQFRVSPEEFTRSLFLYCCRSSTRILARILLAFSPKTFAADLRELDQLREVHNSLEFGDRLVALEKFHRYGLPNWRERLGIRFSVAKLGQLAPLIHRRSY